MIYLLIMGLTFHSYEPTLNGEGRELLVRKDCYDYRQWYSSSFNEWVGSTIRSWLNGEYKSKLDTWVQNLIGTTTYYFTPGYMDRDVTTRADPVLLLSLTELGLSHSNANVEGSSLPIAGSLRIAYLSGSSVIQWTRSPNISNTTDAWESDASGKVHTEFCNADRGSRPCFTLPSTALVTEELELVEG